ncbi:MAG: hypothetical protein IKA33_00945, partial [Candidatus Methanomethylophilaceae archaeon]|nr:hypothetical protein [Candidatus Methanomethylophilaceae archaeon]
NNVDQKNTKHYTGVIAGQNIGDGKITFCSIIDSSVSVNSIVKARGNHTTVYAGGVTGYNTNIISNSVATSTAFSFNVSQKWTGVGIIGGLHEPEVDLYIGGLVGYCASEAKEVSYCFSDVKPSSFAISVDIGSYGNMWGTAPSAGKVNVYAGYLIGSSTSAKSIYECYYTGGDGIKYGIYMDSKVKKSGLC